MLTCTIKYVCNYEVDTYIYIYIYISYISLSLYTYILLTYIMCYVYSHINIGESLDDINCAAPYIIAFGRTKDNLQDVKLVIESDTVLEMPSVVFGTTLLLCIVLHF